ncbi:hypothetical protein V496_09551 [Pseudogymnoascus sp. VKM F-4515 (FW-2607)]|nr:hypothetical protein V496_09551 [Pseudogymnoascus sp. VKM F-4515 (FW-2607)]
MRVQIILVLDLTEIEPVLKGGGASQSDKPTDNPQRRHAFSMPSPQRFPHAVSASSYFIFRPLRNRSISDGSEASVYGYVCDLRVLRSLYLISPEIQPVLKRRGAALPPNSFEAITTEL